MKSIICILTLALSLGFVGSTSLRAEAEHDHDGHEHKATATKPQTKDDHEHKHDHDDDHGDHDHGHGEHEDAGPLRLTPQVLKEFGIEISTAAQGTLQQLLELPGEVAYNADRIAHVTSTVTGIVQEVRVSTGASVKAGQLLAILSSRELAAARSAYLSAHAWLTLAKENVTAKEKLYQSRIALAEETQARDQRLFADKVAPERQALESAQALREARLTYDLEMLEARQAQQAAQIALTEAETALHALGNTHEQIHALPTMEDAQLTRYSLTAPLAGSVTQRHLTVGEVVELGSNEAPFVVADLSSVWVNLTVQPRELAQLQAQQHVTVHFGHGLPDGQGTIAFISPALDEHTRTATARVVLDNPQGMYRPGLFVTAQVQLNARAAAVLVPDTAVTQHEQDAVVFVQTEAGLEPRVVELGARGNGQIEIRQGLTPGERYVSKNTLALKAELNRAALEHAGHVH